MANNDTPNPIAKLAKRLNEAVDKSPLNTCYPRKHGCMQGMLTLIAIDLDVYSSAGTISRDKVIEIFTEAAEQIEKQTKE